MASELLNICLQIIEALIAFYFYESVSKSGKGKLKRISILIFSYLIMCGINLLFNYNVVINNIALLLFHFLFSYFLYKQKLATSVFYTIMFACLVGISEISVINITSSITNNDALDFLDDPFSYMLVIIFSKSFLFVALKIIISIINKYKSNEKTNFIFVVYPISLLITIINFILISYRYELDNSSKIILSVSSIAMIIAVIIACIIQQQMSQNEQELVELKAIQQKKEIESTYFELLEHQNEELQIFVHDMQKHLDNINNLSTNSDESKAYIEKLSKDLSESNSIGKTHNKLLDLIISKYIFITQKNNIEFETNIHSSNLSFIENNDLTSIFNNLLDNAVDAAKESEQKKITLSINNFTSMLTVDLCNSCQTAPVLKNNQLVSTKQKEGLHGYGLKSVTKAVNKYNGDIEWYYDEYEKTFNVSIIFNRS